jgi:hypothetical protein
MFVGRLFTELAGIQNALRCSSLVGVPKLVGRKIVRLRDSCRGAIGDVVHTKLYELVWKIKTNPVG